MLQRALLCTSAIVFARGSKSDLARHFRESVRAADLAAASDPDRAASYDVLRGTRVTLSSGTSVNDSYAWSTWALAEPAWARAEYVSYKLGYPGKMAMVDWGGIAEYACQGALIVDKLLCFGGDAERAKVRSWLLTMPVSASGEAWEAQNSQWHVSHQGAWESSAEALMMLRLGVAHGAASSFSTASERLVCVSRDGGVTFTVAGSGVEQPGLTESACSTAPSTLLSTLPLTGEGGSGGCSSAPQLFSDVPSAVFPGPSAGRDNGGRILVQALSLGAGEGGVTHVSLALDPLTVGDAAWPTNVTIFSAASGAIVASASVPRGGAPKGSWTVVPIPTSPLLAGLYVIVLSADVNDSPGARPQDSWFTGSRWVTNACPASGGGASQATYGDSPLWLRNETADPRSPRLVTASIATVAAASSLEITRVLNAASTPGVALGVSLADTAALLLSHILALSSLTPTPAPGRYDVFVIPDALFRGSLEDGVNSACSYYDLLRIGFASSYISLRVLEAVEAYSELQSGGFIPSTCVSPAVSAFGVDNAHVLRGGLPPCYTSEDVLAAAAAIRVAVGTRFINATTGAIVDWFGCAVLGTNGGDTTACRLADVVGGVAPMGSPLNTVSTGFLPSISLAAKLGVPAGGVDVNATRRAFSEARDIARDRPYAGPGWFLNSLHGLEDVDGGSRSLIVHGDWKLTDADGFAIHSDSETGDWHIFSPSWIAGGGAHGYGQYGAQAENGGRFFSTTAFVFDGGAGQPYAQLFDDWFRAVRSITAVGAQIESNDTSTPLLPADPLFLSTPVNDTVIFTLCDRIRIQVGYPNITDRWGAHFCDFYEDLPWALPENGDFLVAAARAFVGLRVRVGGLLEVNGVETPVSAGMAPWKADGGLPSEWPPTVAKVEVWNIVVDAALVNVTCDAATDSLNCTVVVAP